MPEKKEPETEKKERKITKEEFEKKAVELAKQGLTSEKIGETLRKQGFHSKEIGIKISKILKKKGLYTNPDVKNVGEKLEKLREHYRKNHQDKRAMREITRIHSQLRTLKQYHKIE